MAGTGGLIRKLTGPGTWSSLAPVSSVMRSGRHLQAVAQLDGAVALAVAVDGVGEGVHALGHERAQLLAQLGLALVDQAVEGANRDAAAEALEQLGEAPLAQPDRGHGGAGVALDHLGEARVAEEHAQQLVGHHALAHHPHGWHDDALLEDVGAVGRQRARPHAADIVEVRPRLREGRELAVGEHGRQEHLVGRMGDGALRGVAVVEPVDVAGAHGVERVVLGDGAHHVAEHGQVGADDQAARRVEQSGIEVFLLANERRHGRALDHGLHLALNGPAARRARSRSVTGSTAAEPSLARSCVRCIF